MEKVINRFEVFVSRPAAAEHIDWLHDEVELRYQYLDANRRPERLRMNSTLFSLLLDLADGYQLIGESSQDAFANLSVFTQRLAEETQDEIFAWAFGVNGLVMQPPEPLMEIWLSQLWREIMVFVGAKQRAHHRSNPYMSPLLCPCAAIPV